MKGREAAKCRPSVLEGVEASARRTNEPVGYGSIRQPEGETGGAVLSSSAQVRSTVFAIVISEKGGAERRESFERPEITVGRVQGNDLMLPKGNVSKRHAKLTVGDAHCVVTDLSSTNGTYVNRRRISQPTTVRAGDRIYIGDFVLRIELEGQGSLRPAEPPLVTTAGNGAEPAAVDAADRVSAEELSYPLPVVPPPPRLPSGTKDPAVSASLRVPRPRAAAEGPAPAAPPRRRNFTSSTELETAAYRSALRAVVERVAASLGDAFDRDDADTRGRVNGSVGAALSALRGEGRVPPGIPVQRLAADAEQELIDLGPLGLLWREGSVSALAVTAFDRVMAQRGEEIVPVEPPFTSDEALQRVVRRLCLRAGVPLQPGEVVVERTLTGGVMLTAALPPFATRGSSLVLRRVREASTTLDELVRTRALSAAVAALLEQCVAARVDLLVIGRPDPGIGELVSALAATTTGGGHVVVQSSMTLPVPEGAVSLGLTASRAEAGLAVRLAARLPGGRLILELASVDGVLGLVEATAAGVEGVVTVAYAADGETGLRRLAAELAAARPGLPVDTARDWLGGSLRLVIEVGRGGDGVFRLMRVCEIARVEADALALEEIFTVSPAGADGETGALVATGRVPRVVDVLRRRGLEVDLAVFSAPSGG